MSILTLFQLIPDHPGINNFITPDHSGNNSWLLVEHGRFSILENRTWPIFDFRASNIAYFRFSSVEHGLFSIFGRRTRPTFNFRVSNMAYFRFQRHFSVPGHLWISTPWIKIGPVSPVFQRPWNKISPVISDDVYDVVIIWSVSWHLTEAPEPSSTRELSSTDCNMDGWRKSKTAVEEIRPICAWEQSQIMQFDESFKSYAYRLITCCVWRVMTMSLFQD